MPVSEKTTEVAYDISDITSSTKLAIGDTINIPYSGAVKSITLPAGKFQLQCWGAQGGYRSSSAYGKGGYAIGTLTLTKPTIMYIYVGGSGQTGKIAGGFNGGGKRGSYNGGGGATDFRIGQDSLYARVIVAGGGASDGASSKYGGAGGGIVGQATVASSYGTNNGPGNTTYSGSSTSTTAASQSTTTTSSTDIYGGFGFGGNGVVRSSGYGGAGGGGWYGGSGTYPDGSGDDDKGGAGGSGYVYTSSTASQYPSGCLLNSEYYLTDASTTIGTSSFASTSGGTETGHVGDGYARIKVFDITPTFSVPVRVDDEWKLAISGAVNINNTWKNITQMFSNVNRSWVECKGGEPPIEGTWRFNNSLTNASFELKNDFTSNGINYSTIKFSAGYFSYDQVEVYQHATSVDSGWKNETYRTITFTSPVSVSGNKDFVTWFKANAVKLVPISGTWVFNNPLSESATKGRTITGNVEFVSNNVAYTSMTINYGSSMGENGYDISDMSYDTTKVNNVGTWTNQAYRTITFTDTQMVPKDFYQWFIANARPFLAKGKTLNEYTWEEIRMISDANKAEEYGFKAGDTKSITINGTIGNTTVNQTVNAVILGINHNAAKEGNNRIHFLIGKSGDNMCGMTDSQYNKQVSAAGWCSMNTSNTNSGGWNNSYMRKTFLGNTGTPTSPAANTFLVALPVDLRAEMKSCTKYSDNTGGTSNPASVTATTDYLFLLAEFEVFGTRTNANTAEQNNQMQYDYFKTGSSKIAGSWGSPTTAVRWWLRSVYAGVSDYFCRVYTSGAVDYTSANRSLEVLPGFCV